MKNFFKVPMVILLLLVMFNHSFAMGGQLKKNVVLNNEAPDFTLYDTVGEKATLSDFRNKNNVILFFWFARCPFCIREIDALNKNYPEIKNDDFKFLSINIGDSSTTVKKYIRERNISFPIFLDRESDVAVKYNLLGVPTYVLIDKKGVVKLITNEFPQNYKEIFSE